MLSNNQVIIRQSFRNGKVYNNGTDKEGIDCDSEPVVPWIHGYELMKAMREVSRHASATRI